jgi:hypothetical protein
LRSTTFVFNVWCTFIQYFGDISFQTGDRKNDLGATALRRRARPLTARRPRSPADRGSLFPIRCVPRPLESSRRARATDRAVPARCAPRTTSSSAAPYRTHAGRGRVPRPHLRGHAVVTPAEPPLLMSCILPSSRRHCRSTAPSAPSPSSCAPSCFLRLSNHPCLFPRPYRTFTCHLLSRSGSVAAGAEPPRPPPPVFTACPRWRVLRPNSGHP